MTAPDYDLKLFWIETYGCQMNTAESNAIVLDLKAHGWEAAESADEADLVILNTCSVRKTAENRIWGRLGHYRREKKRKPLTLAVTGCMAERMKGDLRKQAPHVDFVIGTYDKYKIGDFLDTGETVKSDLLEETSFSFQSLHLSENDFRALVPIMHGCDNFCSYCIVPYVRGREISRSPEEILKEIRLLEERGVKEITLLGQNVNSYRYSGNKEEEPALGFPELLERILMQVSSIEWVRFLSSHPKDLSPGLIELIGRSDKLCSHIHLAVQHGSNSVLGRMNRHYTREEFLELVNVMKSGIPDLSLTTDLIIGFPGETEEDLEAVKEMLETVRFDDAFTYHYNPREGTKASSFTDEVPDGEKMRRLGEIIELQRSIQADIKRKRKGVRVKVLVEGISRKNPEELLARTERNEMAVFPGDSRLIGTFQILTLTGLSGNTFKGELSECPGN